MAGGWEQAGLFSRLKLSGVARVLGVCLYVWLSCRRLVDFA
jgi:hypothetical protein